MWHSAPRTGSIVSGVLFGFLGAAAPAQPPASPDGAGVRELGACCYSDGECRLVEPHWCATRLGDLDCDGDLDFDDVDVFVHFWGICRIANADCNRDGELDYDDINPFVELLSTNALITGTFLGAGTDCDPNPCLLPADARRVVGAGSAGPAVNAAAAGAADGARVWPCPLDAFYAQPAEGCDGPRWSGYTSAIGQDFSYLCQEDFELDSDIRDIHWWGLVLQWNNGWLTGDPAALAFDIIFYADAGGAPGAAVCIYTGVTPTFNYLETCYGAYDVYHFEVQSLSPCLWDGPGWVSIQSQQAPPNYDVFLWVTSAVGDFDARQNGSSLGTNLSLCLTGIYIPAWGACCDDTTSNCTDNVERLDCLAAGGRFAVNTLCADLQPRCGQGPSACCYDNCLCRVVLENHCTRIGDANCDGVIDFDDINAFVEVLSGSPGCNRVQCDCNLDGDVNFLDINALVNILGGGGSPTGTWLGAGASCDECPRAIICPPGATPENEPCYTNTNGGYDVDPPVFSPIGLGDVVCGTSYFDGSAYDSDWYRFEATETLTYSIVVFAEFDAHFTFINDPYEDCLPGHQLDVFVAPCEMMEIVTNCEYWGTYYLVVRPQFTVPLICTDGDPQYWLELDEAAACYMPVGGCCMDGECCNGIVEQHCIAAGGQWLGESMYCYGNICVPGETCLLPLPIPDLPYTERGNTCAFTGDYDAICPFTASGSPDVAYEYTPMTDTVVEISLCLDETNYDTKLYVYEDHCWGAPLACNDDFCTTPSYPTFPHVSKLENLILQSGHTYYIVVDGYDGACGDYGLAIAPYEPCAIICPGGASPENEPCYTDTNGGCGSDPLVFGSIHCGETICGTSYFDGTYRDTEWFRLELPGGHAGYDFTLRGQAEFDLQLFLIRDDGGDCYDLQLTYTQGDACATIQVLADCVPATSTYYAWLGPQFTTAFECTNDDVQYWITLQCAWCDVAPGACCLNGICHAETTIWECQDLGGEFMGEFTLCDPSPCSPPVGDNCANAKNVNEVPYTDLDDTCAYSQDYDAICPFGESTAPDVVYRYVPPLDEVLDITLCLDETNYDTKLYVYEGTCQGEYVACNDDFCTTTSYPLAPYVSKIESVLLSAGNTYYIIVDGYGSECGTYRLSVTPPPPDQRK